MLQQNPLVTVLIDNYNYEQYLARAIDSALGQTYSLIEVIVVDDGSKDNSRAVIESYGDRIKSVFKQNGGQGSAFNAGLPEITGDFVCLLDADDVFVPQKVEKVVSLFQSMPDVDWIFHALQDVNASGEPIAASQDHGFFEDQVLDLRGLIRQGQELPYLPPTSALCFRRSLLQQILPMPEALRISSDNFLCLSSAFLSQGYLCGQTLSQYRIHGKNLYAQRQDIGFLHGETNIRTSYYLRQRFPETAPFTNRRFSHAVGQITGRTGLQRLFQIPESKYYFDQFFSGRTWFDCAPRMLVNYLKSSLKA
jgi:cellulose synthase/poly-beta-1,6-N-acetylglucosamine synthase-like glycosyltransferase